MEPFLVRRWIPPWATPWQRLRYRLGYLTRPGFGVAHMSWGSAGPKALTHHIRRHGLARFARPPAAFYPVGPHETGMLIGPDTDAVRGRITGETFCIHLWNKQLSGAGPAAGESLVARIRDGTWRVALGVGSRDAVEDRQ
jgi:hypothetical protein